MKKFFKFSRLRFCSSRQWFLLSVEPDIHLLSQPRKVAGASVNRGLGLCLDGPFARRGG